ncbi:OsmC family protein [Geoalkalibacter halelectricus]|uniref:OsmC family protein n=1 Tax=Geoalkalibacter halelectricus TaxID=2847045 RepID=A0ABY5ZH27_9BACT|nr:OsmC family protein [Geoalkalibacter halelectricus]MDO3376609.1 OsmC family protein [Geoalkalibacter halelectricus]UWZ78432.1 OsmC family protein [Geoalkalibacter halelectricus]
MSQDKIINGVNVTQLVNTIELIKEKPTIADFKFRATNKWVGGTHNRARVKDFFGAGEEDNSRAAMTFEIDEPPVLLGENQGANPVEYLLVALSGCLTTSLVAHAAARGIQLRSVESRLEGDLDLHGFLGLSETAEVGYKEIRVSFKIDADLSPEQKQELIEMAQKYSPVFNSIAKPVPVKVGLAQD